MNHSEPAVHCQGCGDGYPLSEALTFPKWSFKSALLDLEVYFTCCWLCTAAASIPLNLIGAIERQLRAKAEVAGVVLERGEDEPALAGLVGTTATLDDLLNAASVADAAEG